MKFILSALAFLLTTVAFGQDELLRDYKLEKSKVSIQVYSIKQKKIIYSKNPDLMLIPASNAKLFTTACALVRLGSDFKYRTNVYLDESSNLLVAGSGDPNISARFYDGDPEAIFRGWSVKLKQAGISTINNIDLYNGIFDQEERYSDWANYDPSHWYAAPISAISFNDNCIDIKVQPTKKGRPCEIYVSPATKYIKIVNNTKTVRSGRSSISFKRNKDIITVYGQLREGSQATSFSCAIDDPVKFFGSVLKEALEKEAIQVNGQILVTNSTIKNSRKYKLIATLESDLLTTLKVCNTNSQNFYAEMILKFLGYKFKGYGTRENGITVINEFLHEIGIDETGLYDGSGLARSNLASSGQIVSLLKEMYYSRWRDDFTDTLAKAAEEGSLRKKFEALKGRLRAKSGYISGVHVLSGYLQTKSGDTLIFSIIINGSGSTREFQEKFLKFFHDNF